MIRFRFALLTLLALLSGAASAQEGRNELSLDVGILSGGVSYARRLGDSPPPCATSSTARASGRCGERRGGSSSPGKKDSHRDTEAQR